MRKFRCVSVNEGNKLNFTVGKVYETDDNMLRCKLDCGYVLTNVKIMEDGDIKSGLVFEEVFDKEEKVMKFDIKKEKIAVLCNTKEKVEKLCEMLGEKMFKPFHVAYPNNCYVGYDWDGNLTYDSYTYFTNKKNYKLVTFEEFMGDKEDNKMEFKVGDRVEILGGTKQKGWVSGGTMKKYIGTKGTIVGIWSSEPKFKVKMDLDKDYWFFNTEDLKLASNTQPQQFTITISDSITTLETNGKKVEIKRYYADKHDVEFAMQEVVNKYFDEVRKEEMEAKLLKVGDKVKVVNNGKTYDTFKTWLIENNVSIESAIKWKRGECPKNGEEYAIKMIVGTHVLIEDDYNAYIISVEGLEVVK